MSYLENHRLHQAKFASYHKLENPGKFYHNVKSSKDRRQNKIDSKIKETNMGRQKTIDEFKDKKIQILEKKLEVLDQLKGGHKKYSDKFDSLYRKGLIDLNGDLLSEYEQNLDQANEERKSENSYM